MADVPIIDNSEKRINETVCVDTKRIFDSCVSKDCLEDLRITFFGNNQRLVDDAITVKTRDASITAVSIDVDDVPFNRGYYSVDITFYFRLRFDTYSAPCATPQMAEGYTSFNKKCILYGSEGNVKIFTSDSANDNLDCPEAPQYTNPNAKVQAVDPVVLSTDIIDVCECPIPYVTSFPQSVLKNVGDASIFANSAKAVLVTLGLFSIVQMERDCQMLMPAYDYCIPERECECSTQNPCDTFRDIEFPVDEFFPVEKAEGASCCGNS